MAVLASAIAAGCARPAHDDAGNAPVRPAHSSAFRSSLPLMKLEQLNQPPLKCGSPQTCPPAVGELVAMTFRGPLNCTATLVAPRIVLTASHCIPWENLAPDKKFNGNCWIRWPEAPGTAEKGRPRLPVSVPCERLLSATTLGADTRTRVYDDHAFIQIPTPQTGRAPMTIAENEEPEKNGMALMYGVNLGRDAHLIEFAHCSRDDHFELPGQVAHGEGTIIFPSCRVLHGYSGGPILEPLSRRIIGVISGVVDFDAEHPEKPLPSVGTSVRPWRGRPPHQYHHQ